LTGKQVDSYLPDWLGGVADVVAPQGNTQASYDYDAYGNPRTDGTAGASTSPIGGGDTNGLDNPVRFTGACQDPLLGSRYSFPCPARTRPLCPFPQLGAASIGRHRRCRPAAPMSADNGRPACSATPRPAQPVARRPS